LGDVILLDHIILQNQMENQKRNYIYFGIIVLFLVGAFVFTNNNLFSQNKNNTASVWSSVLSFFGLGDDSVSNCGEGDISLSCPTDASTGCFCEGGILGSTKIIWQAYVATTTTWKEAGLYCDSLGIGNDWRLPSFTDLDSVYDSNKEFSISWFPSIDTVFWLDDSNLISNSGAAMFLKQRKAFSFDENYKIPTICIKNLLESSPTSISTCKELQNIKYNPTEAYTLANNIDCSDTINWNNGKGFSPIGSITSPFTGTFNGNYKTISGLYINRPNSDDVGLFGVISGANISSLGIVNLNITGKVGVGGLVGEVYTLTDAVSNPLSESSLINEVYVSGTIHSDADGGGLAGSNGISNTISNSYSTANVYYVNNPVSGFYNGGLVGSNYSKVINSYSTGYVANPPSGGSGSGGLAANGYPGTYENAYWDINTSGQPVGDYTLGTGLTTSEMKTPSSFSAWDTNIWNLVDGAYPTLKKNEIVPPTNSCPVNNILNAYNVCESCDQNTDYLMTSCGDKPTSNPCNTCSSPERHLSVGAGCWYCVRTCGSLAGTAGMVLNTSTNECECPPGKVFDGYGACVDNYDL
jgi:hypothetical protein